ncbi:MAG: creatininase family protein [Gemmatimonadales bacterium]|nr:MAG: creatininase family protein [Gemmatimonadales bacterium]
MEQWQSFTSAELSRQAGQEGATAVLPVHAVEQHGPHLPLSTDLEIGRGVLREARRDLEGLPIFRLPEQPVGASREHARFAGTLSLPGPLVSEVLVALGRSVATAGIRRLVVFSAHGGNRPALDEAGLVLRDEVGLLVVRATLARFPRPSLPAHLPGLPEEEWREGLHGGAVETSMMLHLRPDLVRMEALEGSGPHTPGTAADVAGPLRRPEGRLGPEGPAPFSWLASDLHPSGVAGNPRLATAELGRHLVMAHARWLGGLLREVSDLPEEVLPGAGGGGGRQPS